MNPSLDLIHQRRSVRAYLDKPVEPDVRAQVLRAAMRAPTAGNMMLYSIIEVTKPEVKKTLAETCDNQPFIAKAPWALLFLADWQRWHDSLIAFDIPGRCREQGASMRTPAEGEVFLACCDALIAAQTAVIAAESFGLGSCYIGDVMEYPTPEQKMKPLRPRFEESFIISQDRYRHFERPDFERLYRQTMEDLAKTGQSQASTAEFLWRVYQRKIGASFMIEMTRSVRAILHAWNDGPGS